MLIESEKDSVMFELLQNLYKNHYKSISIYLQSKYTDKRYPGLMDWIYNKTEFLNKQDNVSFGRRLWHILNQVDFEICCSICGKVLTQLNFKKLSKGYWKTCSHECNRKQQLNVFTKTCLMKFGGKGPTSSEEVKQKRIRTWIKNLGVDSPMKSDKVKQHHRESCMKSLGYNYPFQSPDVNKKADDSRKQNYGVQYMMQNHDIFVKAGSKYLYNNIWFSSSPEIAYYIWLTDNNIKFEYQPNRKHFIYFDKNNIKHFYYPDFYLIEEDQYIEIKGDHFFDKNGKLISPYDRSKDYLAEAKQLCMIQNNIKILKYNDYKIYLDYIKDKYGKDYLKSFKTK